MNIESFGDLMQTSIRNLANINCTGCLLKLACQNDHSCLFDWNQMVYENFCEAYNSIRQEHFIYSNEIIPEYIENFSQVYVNFYLKNLLDYITNNEFKI